MIVTIVHPNGREEIATLAVIPGLDECISLRMDAEGGPPGPDDTEVLCRVADVIHTPDGAPPCVCVSWPFGDDDADLHEDLGALLDAPDDLPGLPFMLGEIHVEDHERAIACLIASNDPACLRVAHVLRILAEAARPPSNGENPDAAD